MHGLIVHLNQITVIVIPHGTNRALEIRTMMRSKVRTTDGKEIFVFNGQVLSVMRACKAVSKVTIVDETGVEVSLEQVRTMQFVLTRAPKLADFPRERMYRPESIDLLFRHYYKNRRS